MSKQWPEYIWFNGEIKPWADAQLHAMAHVVHYGSSVFEGIRAYDTPNGPAVFRLNEHLKRLYDSAKIHVMDIPYDQATLRQACLEVIKANGMGAAYLRPVAWRGLGGVSITAECPIEVAVAALPMGAYLGEGALENGIDACVTSWNRPAPNTIPTGAKAGGNYLSGQLIAREARRLGFDEGIALASNNLLSEGAGENLFLAFDGALHTTPTAASILKGITRASLMQLAREDGIEVIERDIPREDLYLADELFMCGTAAEVTPVRSVDARAVGNGEPGPITQRMQTLFFDLFKGGDDSHGWLTHF